MRSEEIDLGAYFKIIRKRLWLIIACVTCCTALAAFYSYSTYVPVYQASTKLIVNQSGETDPLGRQMMNLGAIGGGGGSTGSINTYKEIIRTPIIMDKVVGRYPHLDVSAGHLMATVNAYALNNTEVMVISTTDYSHERAVMIVNAVSDVFQAEIPKISEVNQVIILTEAQVQQNPQPINEKQNTYIILGFMASLIMSIGIVILLDSLDDSVKTDEDVRAVLGLSILSSIPKVTDRRTPGTRRASKTPQKGEGSYAAIKS